MNQSNKGIDFMNGISTTLIAILASGLSVANSETPDFRVQNAAEWPAAATDSSIDGAIPTLWVGNEPECTHSTIQAAINAVPSDTDTLIRVKQGTYTEALNVSNKTLTIWGGYVGCVQSTPSGTSTVLAPPNSRPLTVFANSGAHIVNIRGLNLAGGRVSELDAGGGILSTASGSAQLNLGVIDTFIEGNDAGNGGGIAVQNFSETAVMHASISAGSVINDNVAAAQGGGIWCSGPGNQTIHVHSAAIQNNRAASAGSDQGQGGGIFIDNCRLNVFSPRIESQIATEIRFNTSHGSGGGIYARNGSIIHLRSSNGGPNTTSHSPVRVHGNNATGSAGMLAAGQGGGIWVDDTELEVHGAWIDNNTATGNGGGIYAALGSQVQVDSDMAVFSWPTTPPCHTFLECTRLTGNNAGDTGGAIFLRDSGTVATIEQTVIRDNSAQAGTGASLFAQTGTNLTVTSSLLYGGNAPAGPPNYVFWVGESAIVNLFWSTVTDNLPGTSVFRFGGTNSLLRLRGSIIYEPGHSMGTVSIGNTPSVDSDCVVWHNSSLMNAPYNFTGGEAFHLMVNPQFTDPTVRDYQLTLASPAVDFCDSSLSPGTAPERDLLLRARGLLVKDTPLHGPFDLGAFEFLPDRIFADRFQ